MADGHGGEGRLSDFIDLHPPADSFREAVIDGLSKPQKELPSKLLYDARGSQLFDRITELAEYYPTRTELALLRAKAGEIAALAGPGAVLVEYGSGASVKVRILLDALTDPAGYIAIEISREHLEMAAKALATDYPDVPVMAVCADYTQSFALPDIPGATGRRVGFFPGSTIGNFTPDEAVDFLSSAARTLGPGAALVIGADLKKDVSVLRAAYNDAEGVTAAFNLNLLERLNREMDATFDTGSFSHDAIWNPGKSRIEMHIRAERPLKARVDGMDFRFDEGETIHTENSYKYSLEAFQALARKAGFEAEKAWTDPKGLFSVHFLSVPA